MEEYKTVSVKDAGEGFVILLDDVAAKTPAGNALIVPCKAMANKIVQEISFAQHRQDNRQTTEFKIKKSDMHFTALAALAIDVISVRRDEVERELLAYAETDQLLYREDRDGELIALQQQKLDPWVEWAQDKFSTYYKPVSGVIPVSQPEGNKEKYKLVIDKYDIWQLAALLSISKITCSLILALAMAEKKLSAKEAFALAYMEEEYQSRKWGKDTEEMQKIAQRQEEIRAAEEWLAIIGR